MNLVKTENDGRKIINATDIYNFIINEGIISYWQIEKNHLTEMDIEYLCLILSNNLKLQDILLMYQKFESEIEKDKDLEYFFVRLSFNATIVSYNILLHKRLNAILKTYDVKNIDDEWFIEIPESQIYSLGIGFLVIASVKRYFNKFRNNYYLNLGTLTCLFKSQHEFMTRFNNQPKFTNTTNITKTYIMYDEHTKYYKIGKSVDVCNRERTLMSQKPSIRCILYSDDNIELKLHKMFAKERVRGEWFNLSADDILKLISEHGFKEFAKQNNSN